MTQTQALLWTWLLELPIILLAAWYWRISWRRALLAGMLASGVSHPVAWELALASSEQVYRWSWYAIEAGVWLLESWILGRIMGLKPVRALGLSLWANGFSALVGRFLL